MKILAFWFKFHCMNSWGSNWQYVCISMDKCKKAITPLLLHWRYFFLALIHRSEQTTNYNLNQLQYIPRNMHTVTALLCFVVVIHWLIFPYPSGLLHWHCGNLTIAPVPAKQPWWIWINTYCEFIMNDCITTTKQSTTKPCAHFLGYTVMLSLFYDVTRASFTNSF